MALDDPHPRQPARPQGIDGPPSAPIGDDAGPLGDDEVLTCGRLLSQVWELAQDAPSATDPHLASCAQCREAVEGLSALNRATRALRAKDPPGLQALVDRIMRIVRAEVRLGQLLPLADPLLDLRIAESTAAKVLRQAADAVPGVRAAECRLAPTDDGFGVRAAMTVVATLERPLPETGEQVRQSVLKAADRVLGLGVTDVDITVVDVLESSLPAWPETGPLGTGGT